MEGSAEDTTNTGSSLTPSGRRGTEDKNVTRQPKSCYATADLLTHISRKEPEKLEQSVRQLTTDTHTAPSPPPTSPQTPSPGTASRSRERATFPSVFREVFSFRWRGGNGADSFVSGGSPSSIALLQDMNRYVWTQRPRGCFAVFSSVTGCNVCLVSCECGSEGTELSGRLLFTWGGCVPAAGRDFETFAAVQTRFFMLTCYFPLCFGARFLSLCF